MSVTTIYETVGDAWKTNIGPSINSIPSDAFVAFQDQAGNLDVINQASKEMAGGLVSDNVPVPAGAKYFGFDVVLDITAEDLPHLARCENDMKITFVGGLQANGSCQWNADRKIWQLGANDGSGWVDTGYANPLVVGRNKLQLRLAFDGKVWSFTGIRVNDDGNGFVPDQAKFGNLPANQSGWGPGLHPQLQTEVKKAPWFLREVYEKVRVLASDAPIGWDQGL
jgi:hypothetical protein